MTGNCGNSPAAIREKITRKKKLLDAYNEHLISMLDPSNVQSYTIGKRSLARYNLSLKDIQAAIAALEKEIAYLEGLLCGTKSRKVVAAVLRDW